MKRIVFLILIAFTINSCSLNDEPDRDMVLLPVEEVIMPDNYSVGNISSIRIKYKRPTQCHIFDGFYYDINETTRTVILKKYIDKFYKDFESFEKPEMGWLIF